MSRLIISGLEPSGVGPIVRAAWINDSATHVVAAAICSVWGCVLLSFAFWLSKQGSSGMGAAFACLAYSGGYFWFARMSYRSRQEGRAR
jgi:hypothetical protein